jgi:lysozyme family protein
MEAKLEFLPVAYRGRARRWFEHVEERPRELDKLSRAVVLRKWRNRALNERCVLDAWQAKQATDAIQHALREQRDGWPDDALSERHWLEAVHHLALAHARIDAVHIQAFFAVLGVAMVGGSAAGVALAQGIGPVTGALVVVAALVTLFHGGCCHRAYRRYLFELHRCAEDLGGLGAPVEEAA